jgi:hypothetical protein
MRSLALIVLGGCSFSAGEFRVDASTTGDDGAADASSVADDGAVDAAPPTPFRTRAIDLVDAQVQGGPHVNFPLVVAISDPTLRSLANGGDVATGLDLYFSSDPAGTQHLAHDVERYRSTTGDFVAWVKVPSLTASTIIYLQYGDPSITTSQQMPTQVWSEGYELVVHLNGSGDSTAKSTLSGPALVVAEGKLGSARQFNGTTDYSLAGSAAALDDAFTGGGTFEAWFNASGFGGNSFGRIADKGNWGLYLDDSNATNSIGWHFAVTGGNAIAQWHFGTDAMSLGQWHHIALVFDSSAITNTPIAYVDGVAKTAIEVDAPNTAYATDAASDLYLADIAPGGRTFDGVLDELRLSSVSRSDAWLLTQYRNQSNPAAFYTVSAPL